MKNLILLAMFLVALPLLSACDRHKWEKSDETTLIDISEPAVEKHAKKGIEISEEESEEILQIITEEGIIDGIETLDNTTTCA